MPSCGQTAVSLKTEPAQAFQQIEIHAAALRHRGYGHPFDGRHRLGGVDGFEARATTEGWTSENLQAAYNQGRELERADFKLLFDLDGLTRSEVRRAYRDHLNRTKVRCRVHSERFPTVISDVRSGERVIDASLSAGR